MIRDDMIWDIQRVATMRRGYAHAPLMIEVRVGVETLISVHNQVFAAHVFIGLDISSFQNGAGAWGDGSRDRQARESVPGDGGVARNSHGTAAPVRNSGWGGRQRMGHWSGWWGIWNCMGWVSRGSWSGGYEAISSCINNFSLHLEIKQGIRKTYLDNWGFGGISVGQGESGMTLSLPDTHIQ